MPPVTTWRARSPEPGGTTTRLKQVKELCTIKEKKYLSFGFKLSFSRRQYAYRDYSLFTVPGFAVL